VPRDFAAAATGRLAVHAAMVPARQVGGDLYDCLRLDARHMLFAVADVSGKGAPAGLTMARSFGLIRAAAKRAAAAGAVPDPGEILAAANDDLAAENDSMTFVTVALGTIEGIPFTSEPFALAAGEALFLYSDGVSEAEDMAGGFFGRDRLLQALAQAGTDPRAVVEEVLRAVTRFADGAPQADDITALALRFGG